jgi:hypothetical protein
MKEGKKAEAYSRWKIGEVQVIVATCAFGLGINKPDVRFVIRLPPSISAAGGQVGMVSNHLHISHILIMTFNVLDFGQETWPGNTALLI